MRVTSRDIKVVRDIALSQVMGRDQLISLGYFSSVTRANTRLRQLREMGFVRSLTTPFHGQLLYCSGPKAIQLVGERISPILKGRLGTPRFIQHAICTTNVRIELAKRGSMSWCFEQQLQSKFRFAGREFEVKPDGMSLFESEAVFVEVDLGHVNPSKFRQKLLAYDALQMSGESARRWSIANFSLITVTTGSLRARRLLKLAPPSSSFEFSCQTFEELGVTFTGGWS